MTFYLSHDILATYNTWLVFGVLWFMCIGVLWPMRWYFEGAAYNTSLASVWGDVALILIVCLAAQALKSGVLPPVWAAGISFHVVCAVIGFCVGLYFVFGPSPLWRTHFTDNYHNFVVMGLLVYLLTSTAPIILWSGHVSLIARAFAFLAIWVLLLILDIRLGRIDQRSYLAENKPKTYAALLFHERKRR